MNKPTTPPEAESVNVLQIRRIGNSLGLIIPKDLLAQMGFEEGDRLDVIKQAEGFKIQRHNDLHAKAMTIARQAMKDYANALRELAK